MKIVITGAGGFVGKELTRFFSARCHVIALTRHSLDITDGDAVRRMIADVHPDLVINCAVTGVDNCEADPSMAHAVNIAGPQRLAEAAAEIDAEILHFSTNYVFDGKREAGPFYTNRDAALPINKYGETKLAGEIAVRMAAPKSYIIRTSWVFGSGRKDNFFGFAARALAEKKRLRAVTDIRASVTCVNDLVTRIDEILALHRYETYHVVNDGVCSYYDFALEVARVLRMSNAEIDSLIEAVTEYEMRRSTPRPRYTPMRCLVSEELGLPTLRCWRRALYQYLTFGTGLSAEDPED
ncbi:MAG: dTDP-4-dehydrorhamnose reductase [Chloracidobacterium sp.]|nr:dTDP-4-dehydrorhamnose reductase [Chloracidobacterium sp.]